MSGMRTPTASELLGVWENGFASRPAQRALALLALALPECGHEALAGYSIGVRDDLLLALRVRLFGDQLASVASCPACSATVETSWRANTLRDAIAAPTPAPDQVLELATHGHHIRFRLPTGADLLAIEDGSDAGTAESTLLTRCVLSVTAHGCDLAPAELSGAALAALEVSMAAADPMAIVECALECPACGHGWSLSFDIARFLWSEIHTWAQHLLVDVHKLARSYGWSETDILAMSPGRRSLYLEMSAS